MAKRYHYFYEIKNNLNGKIYRGIHSTNNLNDGYMGSGVGIRNAIQKYGEESFTKTILKFFDTREELAAYEKQQVDLNFILREDTYNQITGGEKHTILGAKLSQEAKDKISKRNKGKKRSDEFRRQDSLRQRDLRWVHKTEEDGTTLKAHIHEFKLQEYLSAGWSLGMGHFRSEENREKIRQARLGSKLSPKHVEAIRRANTGRSFTEDHKNKIGNARLGRRFMKKGDQRAFVHSEEQESYLEQGWVFGR